MYHSLLNFFAYPFIKGDLLVITNPFNEYTCSTFHYLFYYMPSRNELSSFSSLFCRNQGLFWEPGVLQIFLNLLFFIDAFVNKSQKDNGMADYLSRYCNIFYYRNCYSGNTVSCFFLGSNKKKYFNSTHFNSTCHSVLSINATKCRV